MSCVGSFKTTPPLRSGVGIVEAVAMLVALVALETLTAKLVPSGAPAWSPTALWRIALVRAVEIICVYGWLSFRGYSLASFGLTGARAKKGVLVGLALSALFAAGAAGAEFVFALTGKGSFLQLVSGPRVSASAVAPLAVAAIIVGPFFEELIFRGVLYGALRRVLGVLPALMAVTALFALAHAVGGHIPWVQAVGGIAFVFALEKSGSLWAPFTVHALGNLALFFLPYLK